MTPLRRILLVGIAAVLLVGVALGPARGAEPIFGGYLLGAQATGFAVYYNEPLLAIPTAPGRPTVEFSGARTETNGDSGLAGYALASLAWPGSLAANAPPVVDDEIRNGCAPDEVDPEHDFNIDLPDPLLSPIPNPIPPENRCIPETLKSLVPDFPPYPVRAESFYPAAQNGDGSTGDDSDEAGASFNDIEFEAGHMATRAVAESSTARATLLGERLTGIIDAKSFATSSRSAIEGGVAVATSSATIEGLSILGGIVSADSVVSTVRATSDAKKGAQTGEIRFAGFRIFFPGSDEFQIPKTDFSIVVDDEGVHVNDEDPEGPTAREINDTLKGLEQRGITIRLAQSDADANANDVKGEISLNGLLVRIDSSVLEGHQDTLKDVLGNLPEELTSRLPNLLNFERDITMLVGEMGATAAASPLFVPPPFEPPAFMPPVPPTFLPGQPPTMLTTPGIPGQVAGPGAVAGPALAATPVSVLGVPGGMAALLLLLALAGGRGLGRLAVSATTPVGSADASCTLGER